MDKLLYMREDLLEKLLKEFNWLEEIEAKTGERTGEIIHLPVGEGWYELLRKMFCEIEQTMGRLNTDIRLIHPMVIEEKYGFLNVHIKTSLNGLQEIIDKYESISESVCERCGSEQGSLKDIGWNFVLCNSCELIKLGENK